MAEVKLNEETGMFEAVFGDQSVDDVTDPGQAAEILEEEDTNVLENQADILDDMGDAAVEVTPEAASDPDFIYDPYAISPYAAVDTDYSFTPQTWQVNLASSRSFGEHYLMYMTRDGSSRSYWLILGKDISYSNDVYTFADCEQYYYDSYSSTVTYEVSSASGSVNGETYLVYSDLYFDYVGADPALGATPYIMFVLLFIIILLLIVRGKR